MVQNFATFSIIAQDLIYLVTEIIYIHIYTQTLTKSLIIQLVNWYIFIYP